MGEFNAWVLGYSNRDSRISKLGLGIQEFWPHFNTVLDRVFASCIRVHNIR